MKNKKTTGGELCQKLKKLAAVDIRTVDPNDLVDIESIHLDDTLPHTERVISYIEQIGNPYCYRCNGIVVKVSFSGERRIEDCIEEALFTQ